MNIATSDVSSENERQPSSTRDGYKSIAAKVAIEEAEALLIAAWSPSGKSPERRKTQ